MPNDAQFPEWTTPYRKGPAPAPAWVARQNAKPAPFRGRELAGLALAAAAVDVALWNGAWFGAGGVGVAIVLVAVPLVALVVAKKTRRTARLFVMAALLLACAARSVIAPSPGALLSGLALVFGLVVAMRMKRTYVPELVSSLFSSIERFPSRLRAAFHGAQRVKARTRMGRISLAPVLVPIGVGAAFLGVFALANPIVLHAVTATWEALLVTIGFPHPFRIVMWAGTIALTATLFRPACAKTLGSEAASDAAEASAVNVHTARNTLVLLNLLFTAYNALDAACLWSGAPPAGMTSQAYAHQGAAWLTVALVMLTAVVGYFFRGALASDPHAKLARGLAYAWMAQGLLLALGTYRRIFVHISYSGLSDLRIVGILGTTLVVSGMALVMVKLARVRTFAWLLRRQLDAFALTFVVYAVVPTHLVAAEVNVARISNGELRPTLHLFRQARETESVTALLPLLSHPDARVRQGVAALLLEKKGSLTAAAREQTSFRTRDLTTSRALSALTDATPRIDAALVGVRENEARSALYELATRANDGATFEELLSIPGASYREEDGTRARDL